MVCTVNSMGAAAATNQFAVRSGRKQQKYETTAQYQIVGSSPWQNAWRERGIRGYNIIFIKQSLTHQHALPERAHEERLLRGRLLPGGAFLRVRGSIGVGLPRRNLGRRRRRRRRVGMGRVLGRLGPSVNGWANTCAKYLSTQRPSWWAACAWMKRPIYRTEALPSKK